jgi:hypothetical protein
MIDGSAGKGERERLSSSFSPVPDSPFPNPAVETP